MITNHYDYDYYPIFLVHQGKNCSFVEMTRIVQKKGGRMALIISSAVEKGDDIKNELVPDDGTGKDIYIPTLLIARRDGNTIASYVIKNPTESVYLELDFPTVSYIYNTI